MSITSHDAVEFSRWFTMSMDLNRQFPGVSCQRWEFHPIHENDSTLPEGFLTRLPFGILHGTVCSSCRTNHPGDEHEGINEAL
jgi:hypothetical protein